jgi:hypothetical protein
MRTRTPGSGVHSYVPPRPEYDSEPQLTQVQAPDPTLLELARGAPEERARSQARSKTKPGAVRTWVLGAFLLGMVAGGTGVWSVTRDVAEDVYAARLWMAQAIRSLHARPLFD